MSNYSRKERNKRKFVRMALCKYRFTYGHFTATFSDLEVSLSRNKQWYYRVSLINLKDINGNISDGHIHILDDSLVKYFLKGRNIEFEAMAKLYHKYEDVYKYGLINVRNIKIKGVNNGFISCQ